MEWSKEKETMAIQILLYKLRGLDKVDKRREQMKTGIRIVVLGVVIATITFWALAIKLTSHVDMWEMTDEYHEFGYWEEPKFLNKAAPDRTVKIPVLENGNYPGDPSPKEFAVWMEACVIDPELFNIEGYNAHFNL
jgi:hypothetical protein